MKKVLVAVVFTLGAVACGERRPAEDPSTTTTSVTTETTTTATARKPGVTTVAPSTAQASSATPGGTTAANAPDGLEMAHPVHNDASVGGNAAAAGGAAPSTAANPDADNTKMNERDRKGALTPMDQGGGNDRDITAAIRRAVVADKGLSFTAKNVKIITIGGKVTLRGAVKTDDERASIEAKAKAAPGVSAVDNQLEVKK